MNSSQNRVALVSGASRGLGAAIARQLARDGHRLAINYFGSAAAAGQVAQEIRRDGGEARIFAADVRDESQIDRMLRDIQTNMGPVEILVVNATGPQPMLPLEETTWQTCLDQLEFFVKSPLLLAKATVPSMKNRRWGRIINIGSEVFERGIPRFASYVAAKGAQVGLTRSWAMELAAWNITVNLVAPGWIPTDRHMDVPQSEKDQYAAAVPMKRMGSAEELANVVAFLASDAASYVTGQKISVNGGNTLQ
ncbi:MAG TPA: SDR family oxidoreductase [Tepidisphaeraceae bacterium]|nr:SDR family oxidoreductase [Tepidisphaeraceae bacterium]